MILTESLKKTSDLISAKLDEILPKNFSDSRLVEAMRYSAISDGKCVRPFLLIETAKIFGIEETQSITAAAAIEMIHTYSLIHDDLPAMDNDDLRRGKATCHKKFDEATAILAGDSLLTYAFEILAKAEEYNEKTRCELITVLAQASGFNGMAGGQMIDLENTGKKLSQDQLFKLHSLKTGALFVAAVEMGAIIANAENSDREALKNYAKNLGLAFQIKDDLLDYAESKNKDSQEVSIIDILGFEASEKLLTELHQNCEKSLEKFGEKANLLKDLAEFVVSRKS